MGAKANLIATRRRSHVCAIILDRNCGDSLAVLVQDALLARFQVLNDAQAATASSIIYLHAWVYQ